MLSAEGKPQTKPLPQKEARPRICTLREFAPRFLDGYASANREKPSGIATKETILRSISCRRSETKSLDAITTEDVQRLKVALKGRAPRPSTTC